MANSSSGSSSRSKKNNNNSRTPNMSWLYGIPVIVLLGLAIQSGVEASVGVVTPNGNVFYQVGEELRVICNIHNATEKRNSKHLVFTATDKQSYAEKYVTRLNYSAIELVHPNVPKMNCLITCKISKDSNNDNKDTGVGYVDVSVGSAPTNVTDFRCITINWERLNCTFNFEENPISTNYSVAYGREGDPFTNVMDIKPWRNDTMPVFWFQTAEYRQSIEKLTFQLNMSNMYGQLVQLFHVGTLRSIRPNPPINVTAVIAPGKPVLIKWLVPYQLKSYHLFGGWIEVEVKYMSRFNTNEWHTITANYESNDASPNITLRNLTAHTWYDVRIRIRMSMSYPDRPELWSDHADYVFQTLSRVPDKPPATDVGAFHASHQNDVIIYWRQLLPTEENGKDAGYVISRWSTLADGKQQQQRLNATVGRTMAKMLFLEDTTLDFEIRSANAEGLSKEASRIRVPKRMDRAPSPRDIKKNRNGTMYTLSWMEPAQVVGGRVTVVVIESYTVFWCRSLSELPNQCEESINFQRVDGNTRNFTINTTEGVNFALSANTHNSSSGMNWATCTANESDDIGKPRSVSTSNITATSMKIEWALECVDKPIVRSFKLSYCATTSPKDLTCKEGTIGTADLPHYARSHTITGLKPYTTYRTIITMVSDTRKGPPSEPGEGTTFEATPTKPLNLVLVDSTNTSVQLRWDAPEHKNAKLVHYEVWYNKSKVAVYENVSMPSLTYRLKGLDSYTKYHIVVRACSNCCECSEGSNSVEIRTAIGTPGVLSPQQVNDEPRRRVMFAWSPPDKPAGKVDHYEVQIENTGDNRTTLTRTLETGCYLDVDTVSDATGRTHEHQWQVRIRAVNVVWSAHHRISDAVDVVATVTEKHLELDDETSEENPTTRYQRHSGSGALDPPPLAQSLETVDLDQSRNANAEGKHENVFTTDAPVPVRKESRSCAEEDERVTIGLARDKFREELPGPWSQEYTHVSTATVPWGDTAAIVVFVAVLIGMAVYVYKNFFRLKKDTVVLPPGLTDIAAKPHPDGLMKGVGGGGVGGLNGGGVRGGLLGHGNGMVVGGVESSSSVGQHHQHRGHSHIGMHSDELYEVVKGGSGGSNGQMGSPQMASDGRQVGVNGGGLGGVVVVADLGHSETSSLQEQERCLLEERLETQSSASSSSMMEHEEDGPMLGECGEAEEEEEEDLDVHHQDRGCVLPSSLQHEVLAAIEKSKQLQQQQLLLQQQQQQHQMAMQQQPKNVIRPAANGYVTIAQRATEYTKLGDLMKAPPQANAAAAPTEGITGYVTHKQLADFGQRMQ